MAIQSIFEVHVLQKGRWEIHARHDPEYMEEAVQEAKTLDQLPSVDMVKVILEEYDDVSGNTRESTIYRTPGKDVETGASMTKASVARGSRSGKGKQRAAEFFGDDLDDGNDDDFMFDSGRSSRKKKKKGQTTFVGTLVKILLIILFSVTIATLVAGGTVMGLKSTSLSTNFQTNVAFIVFVIIFLVSALVMSLNFMGKDDLGGAKSSRARKPRAPAKPKPEREPKPQKPEKITQEKIEKKRIEKDEDLDPTEEGLKSTAADTPDPEPKPEPEAEKPAQPEPPQPEPEPEPQAAASLSPHAEKQRVYLMTFLSEGLEKSGADTKRLDSFNKFGLNLFLAGACETMAQSKNLDRYSQTKILAETVSLMGFRDADAAKFADKYEDYLLADARYMQMFQAGRNAINTYMDKDPDSVKYLGQALQEWNTPTQKDDSTGPVTVLFTDIAGSTAMTQDLGDAVAQQIVRAHNRIVREALTQFAGKEVKHTGDGIMASFSTTSNGVEAAIDMQRNVVKHNTNNPDLPLHLKIGINAGEPISEDNDLFGSTVQMAARIVDKAKADEIFVSEIVRGICAGKPITFENRGPYEMKGFSEPPILYEVVWNPS